MQELLVSGSSLVGRHRRSALAARVQAALGLLLLVALTGCSRAPGAAGTEEAPTAESPQEPVVTIAAAVDSVTADGPLQFLVHAAPAPQVNLTVGVSIATDPCSLTPGAGHGDHRRG